MLPVVQRDGIKVKVLAGEFEGVKSPAKSFIPFTYLDIQLNPGVSLQLPSAADQNAFLYVIQGKAKTGSPQEPTYVKEGFLGVYKEGILFLLNLRMKKPSIFYLPQL